ncbi:MULTISPECIES: hypothetical protein [Bacillales]|jgi:hypothetical protein|uniref:Uncharacterized protein n=1 Tax=Brevibacillus aydinogluensis TaxID=927786 RepID=A0AA48RJ99_9BACL|nr:MULTISPECIES: hypothetical protein [Bacillales]MDT3417255.1 hypothetical protein [Brevibacillus aydinogluensis]CAJ1004391.1 hypothetical protein BSPP4475_19035 [Brevibacillus aydinogluensis]
MAKTTADMGDRPQWTPADRLHLKGPIRPAMDEWVILRLVSIHMR